MKTKFKLNWPSLFLGAALCLAVAILVGSKSPAPQTISGTPTNQAEAKVLGPKTQATLNAIMEKLELMDQRIIIVANQIEFMRKGTWEGFARVEGQLGRIEKK
ncbi:MAG: hypothetical protein NTZ12_01145 [Candidatus Aminicenantes bacterium]|nr:hypothetical protein [Candidatus Aminicenantes bacterium]